MTAPFFVARPCVAYFLGISITVNVPGLAAFTDATICPIRGRTRLQRFLLRITTVVLRPSGFCSWGRLLSVVSNTSKVACSAAPALFSRGFDDMAGQSLPDGDACTWIE